MSVAAFILLVWILCLGSLVFLFWFVMAVFRRLSGWGKLARRYRAPEGYRPAGLVRQTVGVGPIRFRRSVCMLPAENVLYLSTIMLRPPLLLPWCEFSAARPFTLYGRSAIRLSVGRPETGSITVRPEQLLAMRPFLRLPVT